MQHYSSSSSSANSSSNTGWFSGTGGSGGGSSGAICRIFLWVVLPLANFAYWLSYARWQSILAAPLSPNCPTPIPIVVDSLEAPQPCPPTTRPSRRRLSSSGATTCLAHETEVEAPPLLESLSSELLTMYKYEQLARMRYPEYTILVNAHPGHQCLSYINPHASQKGATCFALVHSPHVEASLNLLRFDFGPRWSMRQYRAEGRAAAEEATNIAAGEATEAIAETNWNVGVSVDPDNHSEDPAAGPPEGETCVRQGANWWQGKDKARVGSIGAPCSALMPTGFFTKAGSDKGRSRLREKMGPFLRVLKTVEAYMLTLLSGGGHKPFTGTDIVAMVVNEGETDLLLNFACSAQRNNISLSNVLVFCGSEASVPLVRSLGMMAAYHASFGFVSNKASGEYLDRVFVDMMWYKAFSVWLLLRLGFNVLFQDVDLVWFREPYSYFRGYIKDSAEKRFGVYPEAFFSDDGQRGLRYSPFYANSGFYYLLNSPRTLLFAWSIVAAFDILHVTGSHQNVFTTKLIELMDLGGLSPKLLSLDLFSTGAKYHHDKPFMRGIRDGYEHPFNFHMCWTLNKRNKIDYFRKAEMWFLDEQCSEASLMTGGDVVKGLVARARTGASEAQVGAVLRETCCRAPW